MYLDPALVRKMHRYLTRKLLTEGKGNETIQKSSEVRIITAL